MKITLPMLLLSLMLAATPLFAQSGDESDNVNPVPGTRWAAGLTMDGKEYVSCHIDLDLEDGVQVRFAIGSKGSLVLLLNDKYMEAQVSEVLGWKEGQTYRGLVFVDDKKFDVQPERLWQHTLVIPLQSIGRATLFGAKKIAVSVGGIAMRGYDVEGLDKASRELLNCYQQHGPGEKPSSKQKPEASAPAQAAPAAPLKLSTSLADGPPSDVLEQGLQKFVARNSSLNRYSSTNDGIADMYRMGVIANKVTAATISNEYTRSVEGETIFVYDFDIEVTNPYGPLKTTVSVAFAKRGKKWYSVPVPK